MKQTRFYRMCKLLLMAGLLTIALYGCAGGKSDGTQKETTAAEDSTALAEPKRGGSVVVGIQQDLDSLDPHMADAAGTSEVLFNIFEGLVKPDKDGNLVPAVASEYKISEDGMTYTFTLREGITFHNGKPVTIDDVIYSINRCAGRLEGQEAPLVSAYSAISEVNRVDDRTVELVLGSADTELIGYLTAAIIPADYEKQAEAPIGTGPYKFVSYSPQHAFVMEAYDGYWQEGLPYLDKVEFRIVANTDSAMLELKVGSIDLYPYLTSDRARELSGQMEVLVGTSNLVQALFLNNAEPPFDKVEVRQALAYLVDPQEIMAMVADGYGTEIGSNMFPAFGKYYLESTKDIYEPNVEKAKELLAQAGYPDGFEMTITVPSNYQFHVDTAQVIAQELRQANITAKINLVEWGTWLEETYRGRQYQSTIVGLDADLAPKDLLDRYHSGARNNFVNFSNEEYDKVLEEAIASTDDAVKVEKYQRLQQILAEQAASVYIQDAAKLVAINPKLGGFEFYPVYVLDMAEVYFKE